MDWVGVGVDLRAWIDCATGPPLDGSRSWIGGATGLVVIDCGRACIGCATGLVIIDCGRPCIGCATGPPLDRGRPWSVRT